MPKRFIRRPLVLLLLATLALSAPSHAQQPTPLETFPALNAAKLTVWLVFDRLPDPRSLNSLHEQAAKAFPGLQLELKPLQRDEFAAAMQGASSATMPDAVFLDNVLAFSSLPAAAKPRILLGRPWFFSNGWWFLFDASPHAAAAHDFLLWLALPQPDTRMWAINTAPSDGLRAAAIAASNETLTHIRDDSAWDAMAARAATTPLSRPIEFDPPTACDLSASFGATAAPFVFYVSPLYTKTPLTTAMVGSCIHAKGGPPPFSFNGFGFAQTFVVLRKDDQGAWKVLHAEPDATTISVFFPRGRLESLALKQPAAPPPAAATLLSPADNASVVRLPPQTISWTQTPAIPAGAFLVESQFAPPHTAKWGAPALKLVPLDPNAAVTEIPTPFYAGKQPHRWRVWTVVPGGEVAISEWRTINFTN